MHITCLRYTDAASHRLFLVPFVSEQRQEIRERTGHNYTEHEPRSTEHVENDLIGLPIKSLRLNNWKGGKVKTILLSKYTADMYGPHTHTLAGIELIALR